MQDVNTDLFTKDKNINEFYKNQLKIDNTIRFKYNIPSDGLWHDIVSCPICYELMDSAFITSCGHSFCKWCLTDLEILAYNNNIKDHVFIHSYNNCPVCRKEIDKASPNLPLRYIITQLFTVACINNTCKWQGKIYDRIKHYEECDESLVICNSCTFPMERKYISNHLLNDCVLKKIECKDCGKQGFEANLGDHKNNSCENRMIKCETCGYQIKHKDKNDHDLNNCSIFGDLFK
jgi:hypothetical protein